MGGKSPGICAERLTTLQKNRLLGDTLQKLAKSAAKTSQRFGGMGWNISQKAMPRYIECGSLNRSLVVVAPTHNYPTGPLGGQPYVPLAEIYWRRYHMSHKLNYLLNRITYLRLVYNRTLKQLSKGAAVFSVAERVFKQQSNTVSCCAM